MLTFEQIKAIESALGAEAARPVVEAIQSTDTRVMASLLAEIPTKADLQAVRTDIAQLETRLERRLGGMEARFSRLDTMIRVLIGLTALAVAFFSPVAEKLLILLK
jgi:hypothetical protein